MIGAHVSKWLAIPLTVGFAWGWQASAPTQSSPVRRAVVVGIDRYRAAATQSAASTETSRIMPKGRTSQRNWSDLDGAVNDAEAINRGIKDSIGHARQHLNLLGYAFMVNGVALHRHRRARVDRIAA